MEFPKRKSPRIPDYSYSTPNYYFITICTHNKLCIFGNPGKLNFYGKIAEEHLKLISELHKNIRIDKFVVMPNHIHCFFIIQPEHGCDGIHDLSVVIGQYKMSVTKKIRQMEPDMEVWQRSFHDHIIRNQKSYEKIWQYIEDNPLKWEEDCFYQKV